MINDATIWPITNSFSHFVNRCLRISTINILIKVTVTMCSHITVHTAVGRTLSGGLFFRYEHHARSISIAGTRASFFSVASSSVRGGNKSSALTARMLSRRLLIWRPLLSANGRPSPAGCHDNRQRCHSGRESRSMSSVNCKTNISENYRIIIILCSIIIHIYCCTVPEWVKNHLHSNASYITRVKGWVSSRRVGMLTGVDWWGRSSPARWWPCSSDEDDPSSSSGPALQTGGRWRCRRPGFQAGRRCTSCGRGRRPSQTSLACCKAGARWQGLAGLWPALTKILKGYSTWWTSLFRTTYRIITE